MLDVMGFVHETKALSEDLLKGFGQENVQYTDAENKIDYKEVQVIFRVKEGVQESDEVKASIMEHCKKNIAKYAMPYDIEFREDMPKTFVGKVAYRTLEEEEMKKINEAQKEKVLV